LSLVFCTQNAIAACDFSKDIKENLDGSYTYTRDCHIEVGKRVKKLVLLEEQVVELEKTIELKDLALSKQKERADLWMNTSVQVTDKLRSYDSVVGKENTLYFVLGVGVTVLSVWAAGQLVR
jgi:hypothetical protein